MAIKKETIGDFIHQCDSCEIEDGRPTLYWKERDFDLCLECLKSLFFQNFYEEYKGKEKVIVTRLTVSEELRNRLLKKFENKCVKCESILNLQIDHILPFSLGGKTTEDNLQVLCKKCNLKKGNGR